MSDESQFWFFLATALTASLAVAVAWFWASLAKFRVTIEYQSPGWRWQTFQHTLMATSHGNAIDHAVWSLLASESAVGRIRIVSVERLDG